MFKKDLVTVIGVYRKSNKHAYEVEAVDYLNVTKRDAKRKMYEHLMTPNEKRPGISHRNIVKIFVYKTEKTCVSN